MNDYKWSLARQFTVMLVAAALLWVNVVGVDIRRGQVVEVYYGFPLPHTIQNKAMDGNDNWVVSDQGTSYLAFSLNATINVVLLFFALRLRPRRQSSSDSSQ